MKTDLANLVAQLSMADIQALAKMKTKEAKMLPKLQKQRANLAMELTAVDRKIATLEGKPAAVPARKPAQKAAKPVKVAAPKSLKVAAPKAVKAAPKAVKAVIVAKIEAAPKPQKRMKGILEAVKKALAGRKKLKVQKILDAMLAAGFKVPSHEKAKRSIGALLIGQKKYFKKVAEGVYSLA